MSLTPRPPTYRDIAQKAGVSTAAVSFALRDDPRISAPVRAKIRQAAKQLGYKPNPLLSAYQASVRAQKPAKFHAVLGWINDCFDKDEWKKPWQKPFLEGARERASELGYQLDEIWIPNINIFDPQGNAAQWQKILRARGIHGVLLPTINRAHHALLPWDGFSVVCLGNHHLLTENSTIPILQSYGHHILSSDFFYNIHLALKKLEAHGHQKIGLVLSDYMDRETDLAYSSGYLQNQHYLPPKRQLPILHNDQVDLVAAWTKKYQPSAVICSHPEVKKGVLKAGLRVPQDVVLAHLNLASDVSGWSGINRRSNYVGSAAVDMLSSQLIMNETGTPIFAKKLVIEGVWVDGSPA